MDKVLGQRHSTNPPVLIASIPENTPGPSTASTAVVDQEVEDKDLEEERQRGPRSRKRDRDVPESLTIFRKGLKTHLFRVHLDCIATLPLLATIVHCVVLYCIIVLNCVATAVAAIMAVTRGMG